MRHNEDFDALWQQAEAEGFAQKLTREYPAWQRRSRQRRATAIASLAMVLVVGAAAPLFLQSTKLGYDQVCSNRTTMSDSQWADIASEMLMENA